MNKIKSIADALRCITLLPGEREMKCEECPYRVLDEVDDRIPCPADVEIDGKKYWSYCDCDKISLDAAEVLDKLVAFLERNEELVKLLENAIASEKRK